LIASVIAYLLTAVLAQYLSPPEVASPLVSIPALVIAHMLVVAAYTALLVAASPRIDLGQGAIRAAESRAALFAMMIAACNEADATIARTSRWWHHLLAAVGGSTFSVLLARGIAWFLG
jgi:hypothetical protein